MKSVLAMFQHQVKTYPTHIAVDFAGQEVTYQQLDEQSNQLANYLRAKGIGPRGHVGTMIDQSSDLITATLGIFKSQGGFVPLDTKFPEKRIELMLDIARPTWMIVQAQYMNKLSGILQRIDHKPGILIIDEEDLTAYPQTLAEVEVGPNDPCYIYFTSGSTGTPKGIVGCQKGLAHFIQWEIETFGIGPDDRITQLSNPAHDPYLRDFFTPLCAGGTIVIPPDSDTLLDPVALSRWLEESRATLMHCVPSLFKGILAVARGGDQFLHLKYILLAGEKVSVVDTSRWYGLFGKRIQLVNLYGPTETTLAKFYYLIQESDQEKGFVPIGKPIPGAKAVILDENLKICPPGKKGEIYIRTPYMSLGYYNNPERTKEVFIPNPLTGNPEDIVYKTGDMGRFYYDGNIEFIGRVDNQLKIRGLRIEPGEIEAVLLQHPEIKEAVVVDRVDQDGELYLAGYIVAGREFTVQELRKYLSDYLPDYMVPAVFHQLEAMPLNPIGKVDRRALPEMTKRMESGTPYVAPRNEVESGMVRIWQEVLGVERIGIYDNFFDLGGHSLKATKVSTRAYQELGLSLPLGLIFEHPTVAGLLENGGEQSAAVTLEEPLVKAIPVQPKASSYPVSHSQKRLWIIDQMQEENSAYNIPKALILRGALDRARLQEAFQQVVERHEILRTRFAVLDGEIRQIVADHIPFTINYFREIPADLEQFVQKEINTAFDLSSGNLLRATLVRLGEEEHLFTVNMHHIISDAWSINVLINEVATAYNALLRGKKDALTPLPIQYRDFAVWQNHLFDGEGFQTQKDYWVERLGDELPMLDLPTDFPRPTVQSYRGDTLNFEVGPELTAKLDTLCKTHGVTRFMALLSIYYVLLHRYTNQMDLIVGTPIAGRQNRDMEGLIGYFLNVLAMRVQIQPDWSFTELLKAVRKVALDAFSNQDYPIDRLIDELKVKRDMSRPPVFETMFNLINTKFAENVQLEGLTVEPYFYHKNACKFDFSLTMVDDETNLTAEVEYCTDLFQRETIQRMVGHYFNLLRAVTQTPEKGIHELEMLTAMETRFVLEEMNQNDVVYPTNRYVHHLFEAVVEKTPEEIAVIYEGQSLTFRQLNEQANQLAHLLQARGVKPNSFVGIMVERSMDMVVGVIAIFKAGAAYAPIDPHYPEERVQFMLEDTGVQLLLTQSSIESIIPDTFAGEILRLDQMAEELTQYPTTNPTADVDADSLAYIVYTSGSTGKPKGVQGQHGPLLNIHYAWRDYYGLTNFRPMLLQTASISFDGFLCDLCHSVFNGGTAVICPAETRISPEGLYELIIQHRINMIESTPGITLPLMEYIEKNQLDVSFLELLIIGSDSWHIDEYRHLAETFGDQFRVINCYGITETTVDVSCFEAPLDRLPANGMVPIGKPLANVKVYLLNQAQKPVPIGVAGEMFVGGKGVAKGYWQRPELNVEKYISNPFRSGEKMYRSGDLGRFLPDGNIEFLGRIDNQVKIRGYRVEIGEIEAALVKHPEIKDAVVLAKKDDRGQRFLAAYLETAHQFTVGELREFLTKSLPDHMVPAHFVCLEKLPLTPNGKIDRRNLPELDGQVATGVEYVAPRNQSEILMVRIWVDLLNVARIGIDDNFFDLGGDSLRIIQMTNRINDIFKVKLNPGAIYTNPTVRLLCQKLKEDSPLDRLESLTPLRPGTGQKNIFCCHPVGGGLLYYREVSRFIDPEYNLYGIQARGILGDGEPHTNNEERVKFYIEEMKVIQPEGPYMIIGYCAGGDVAYEMVRQMEAMGEEVEGIFLLDSWPFTRERIHVSMDEFERKQWVNKFRTLGINLPNLDEMTLEELYQEAISNELFQQRAANLTPGGITRLREVFQATLVAWQQYYPESQIKNDMVLFKAIDNHDPDICKEKWQEFTTGIVEEVPVPGDHGSMLFSPNADVLGAEINKQLRKIAEKRRQAV